jgi:hypothetical protein
MAPTTQADLQRPHRVQIASSMQGQNLMKEASNLARNVGMSLSGIVCGSLKSLTK